MGHYRPLDPSAFNDATTGSTWLNLGLWEDDRGAQGYPLACQRMALAVGRAAGLEAHDAVVDLGCGCGDSLALWRAAFRCRSIVGVNLTPSECALARSRLRNEQDVKVVQRDALQFLRDDAQAMLSANKVVSVDAIYHVESRAAIFEALALAWAGKPGRKFAAIDTFGSVDMVVGEETSRWNLLRRFPVRYPVLCLLGFLTGIPVRNLLYRPEKVVAATRPEKGAAIMTLVNCELVTDRVLRPFSKYMFGQAWEAIRLGQVQRACTLISAAGFMRGLDALGLVEIACYSIEFN